MIINKVDNNFLKLKNLGIVSVFQTDLLQLFSDINIDFWNGRWILVAIEGLSFKVS